MAANREAVSKDVHEAFRRTCYAYGIEELATRMGMSQGVLYNKANLQEHNHHKPTLQDAVLAQVVTDDKQITQAMAHLMGGVFIDLSGLKRGAGDDAVLDLVTNWMKEQGELFAAFQTAYGDGVIDGKDLKRIRKEAFEVLEAILTFLKRLEALQS